MASGQTGQGAVLERRLEAETVERPPAEQEQKPIAIHKYYDDDWTEGWISHCAENSIPFEVINGYRTDIVRELPKYSAVFWNFNPWRYEDLLFARHILQAAEFLGLKTYPDRKTSWTYDDKVAQKYLLETMGAPLVSTDVFYDLEEALDWISRADLPVIAKLRRGSSANNVVLLKTRAQARAYCEKIFRQGISPAPRLLSRLETQIEKVKKKEGGWNTARALASFIRKVLHARRNFPLEKGYVLFQEFLAGNTYDIRVYVVGDKAWGNSRGIRPGDFRASGSGLGYFLPDRVPLEAVRIAFEVTRKLGAQAMGYDFLKDPKGGWKIIEMSCCCLAWTLYECPGYWDRSLNWHEGRLWPQAEILNSVLSGER
jgi:glutathione synthase/RimK-type ligase-like ATP-grasp enzyme